MKKLSRLVWLVMIAVSIVGLFQVKHAVYNLKRDIEEASRQLDTERESINVLRAEWSYLTQPDRLRSLAQTHLGLQSVDLAQVIPLNYDPVNMAFIDKPKKSTNSDIAKAEKNIPGESLSMVVSPVLKPRTASTRVE